MAEQPTSAAATHEGQPAAAQTSWRAMRCTDDIDSLASLITHDTGAVLIAVESDAIVGSAIAVRDGWRGTICGLAVAPPTGTAELAPRW